MSKSRKSIVTLALSFLIAFCVALVPVKAMAATQYGEVYEWTGDIATVQPTGLLHLDYTYQENQSYDGSNIVNGYVISSYRGDAVMYMDLQGNDVGYINGIIQFPVTFAINDSVGTEYYFNAVLEHSYIDGIVTHSAVTKSTVNSVTVRVFIEFNDYFVEGSDRIPLHFSLSYSNRVNSQRNNVIGYKSTNPVRDEWAGSLTFYSDIRDTPGYDGRMALYASQSATRLQTINGTIKTMHEDLVQNISFFRNEVASYFADLTNNISNWFTSLTSNLSNWYNGLISNLNTNFDRLLNQNNDEHEETINGYQGTGTSDASSRFDQSAGELENVESDLTNITNSSIDNYTDTAFDTSVIASLGSSLVYVVTWFTNFWNMGGLFTSILNVGLALSVAFFILRLRGGS